MQRLFKTLTFAALLAAVGCREESVVPDTARLGADYFPMEKGLWWEYEVDLTTYNLLDSMPSHFFLRELVADTFTDLSGNISYRLERFSRAGEELEWELDSVWTARLSASQAVRIENNVPFIKLTFPLAEGKEWNGNALNSRGEETWVVQSLGAPIEVGDTVYSSSLTIIQQDIPDTLVFQDMRREYFAKEVGLVKKEFIQLNYCSTEECFGQKMIDSGRKLYMELVAYGKQ